MNSSNGLNSSAGLNGFTSNNNQNVSAWVSSYRDKSFHTSHKNKPSSKLLFSKDEKPEPFKGSSKLSTSFSNFDNFNSDGINSDKEDASVANLNNNNEINYSKSNNSENYYYVGSVTRNSESKERQGKDPLERQLTAESINNPTLINGEKILVDHNGMLQTQNLNTSKKIGDWESGQGDESIRLIENELAQLNQLGYKNLSSP